MSTTIGEMTVEELRALINGLVDDRIAEIVDDEAHLELSDELRKRLLRQRAEITGGSGTITSADLAKELSLD